MFSELATSFDNWHEPATRRAAILALVRFGYGIELCSSSESLQSDVLFYNTFVAACSSHCPFVLWKIPEHPGGPVPVAGDVEGFYRWVLTQVDQTVKIELHHDDGRVEPEAVDLLELMTNLLLGEYLTDDSFNHYLKAPSVEATTQLAKRFRRLPMAGTANPLNRPSFWYHEHTVLGLDGCFPVSVLWLRSDQISNATSDLAWLTQHGFAPLT